MGFGISYGGGGDFTPVVRYDARAGRIFRDDKQDGMKTPVDITQTFAAVADFEQLDVGWIHFPQGAAPDFRMVRYGQDPGPRPSDKHKSGVRFLMRLSGACGGDVREMSSVAASALAGLEEVFDAYHAQKASQPAGTLPVIKMVETVPVVTKGPQGNTTNYRPKFAITSWVKRPDDLVVKEVQAAAKPAFSAPPATGSTAVPPPQQAMAMAGADDFG